MIALSVLCPSLISRLPTSPILQTLARIGAGRTDWELLVYADAGAVTIGAKLNTLMQAARGDCVAAIGDDDDVSPYYLALLITAITANPEADVFSFKVNWNAGALIDWKDSDCGFRPMAAIRRTRALEFTYPDWSSTEDRAFGLWLKRKNPWQVKIDEVLYHYNYRTKKPEFEGKQYAEPPKRKERLEEHLKTQNLDAWR